MTEEQKRAAVHAEIARGDESLEEAELLAAADKHAGAISRAYHGAFH